MKRYLLDIFAAAVVLVFMAYMMLIKFIGHAHDWDPRFPRESKAA